jgi:hypothetical protein
VPTLAQADRREQLVRFVMAGLVPAIYVFGLLRI